MYSNMTIIILYLFQEGMEYGVCITHFFKLKNLCQVIQYNLWSVSPQVRHNTVSGFPINKMEELAMNYWGDNAFFTLRTCINFNIKGYTIKHG